VRVHSPLRTTHCDAFPCQGAPSEKYGPEWDSVVTSPTPSRGFRAGRKGTSGREDVDPGVRLQHRVQWWRVVESADEPLTRRPPKSTVNSPRFSCTHWQLSFLAIQFSFRSVAVWAGRGTTRSIGWRHCPLEQLFVYPLHSISSIQTLNGHRPLN